MRMKLLFKATTFFLFLLDKYRAGYFAYIYSSQVSLHESVSLGRYSSIIIPPGARAAKLTIKKQTRFRKFCTITLDASGELIIGENTFFNNYCSLNCLGRITIGNNTLFGEGIKMYDHNHVFNKKDVILESQGMSIGQITIGNNCWIGSNCVILNNVVIGDNVVIGAGCIISASIPSNTLVKATQQTIDTPIIFR